MLEIKNLYKHIKNNVFDTINLVFSSKSLVFFTIEMEQAKLHYYMSLL